MADVPRTRSSTATVDFTRLSRIALWSVLALYTASSIRAVVRLIPEHRISDSVMGPWFYFDYSEGFVRRALPGELLSLVSTPSPRSVEIAGWAISLAAVPAVVFIAVRVGSLAVGSTARLATTTLILICPLGLTTLLRDPGRADYIGMIAMASMVLVAVDRRPSPIVATVVVAAVTSVAVASEEFLIAFLVPVGVALLYVAVRADGTGQQDAHRRCAKLSTLALSPAIALALASAAVKPSPAYIDSIARRSQPQTTLGPIWEFRHSFRYILFYVPDNRSVSAIVATTFIWMVIYVLAAVSVRILVGRFGRWFLVAAVYFALLACVSILMLDARRWWTLAFVSLLAVTGMVGSHERPRREESSAWVREAGPFVVAVAFVVLLYGQTLPNTIRTSEDPGGDMGYFVGRGYVDEFAPFWVHGQDMP